MSDFQQYDQHCEGCLLVCEYRGVSPLALEKDNGIACVVIHETKRSCLVGIPASVMIDTITGNARSVRVKFIRLKKGSRWKRSRL